MELIFTSLLTICLFFTGSFYASAQTDYEKIIADVNTEIKKGFTASATAINAGITIFMANMKSDSSFNDLNYAPGVAGYVPFNDNLTRLRTMAIAYTYPGATYFESEVLYNKIVSGSQYWNANEHDAFNWFNDQISYPKLLGEILIEMRGGEIALPATDETNAINYLTSLDNPSGKTGANRVYESVHWIYSGALTANASRVTTGVTQAQSTLTLVNSGQEANAATGLAGIYKYCKDAAGEWVSYGTFGSTATEGIYFGITGEVINGLPVLYVTRDISATATVSTNQLLQLMEAGGYNETMSLKVAATTDATASGNKGTLRGVAFYPTPTYYKGSGNLNEVSNWGSNIGGSGTNPSDFTTDQQTFFITNGSAATLSANLVVSGTNSKIILGDGTNTTSLTIPANFSINSEMDVYNNAVLNIQKMMKQ